MTTGLRGSVLLPLVAVLVVAAGATTRADRLHLEGGGAIDVESWWIEGDTLMYESGAGTVGIPRSLVLRIEKDPPDGGGGSTRPSLAPEPLDRAKRREAAELFRRGKADLLAREFESAATRFHEALGLDERLTAARVGYAVSEMALGRDGLALAVVLDGLVREPDNAELLELLGDLRNREERVIDALEAWRRALAGNPAERLREKIAKARRELEAGGDYAFSTSSHFNLRYDSAVDRALAASVVDYLEAQYGAVTDRFRHAPLQPITVVLYPAREFRDVTLSDEDVGGLYDGKIRVPLGGLRRLDPRAEAVLRHELTHAVVHSKTRGNCPRWLHEGLAQIVEGRAPGDAERQQVARLLADGDPAAWESRGFSYPAALSLVRWLEARRGRYGLLDVLDLLGDGRTVDEALEQVFGESYAALCTRWAADVRERGR